MIDRVAGARVSNPVIRVNPTRSSTASRAFEKPSSGSTNLFRSAAYGDRPSDEDVPPKVLCVHACRQHVRRRRRGGRGGGRLCHSSAILRWGQVDGPGPCYAHRRARIEPRIDALVCR
jgi:hypothetical protein